MTTPPPSFKATIFFQLLNIADTSLMFSSLSNYVVTASTRVILWHLDKHRVLQFVILVNRKPDQYQNNILRPLYATCHCLRTMTRLLFCRKKLSFAKCDEKRSTHYLSWTTVFTNVCSNRKYNEKKFFKFVRKLPTTVNAFCESFSRNAHKFNESLFTHYSCFAQNSCVHSFFIIVRE